MPKRSSKKYKTDASAFYELAGQLQDITKRAVKEYSLIVEDILRSDSRDISFMEHVLDGLLGFCCDPDALLLYRKLCRHCYMIDPEAAVFYVNSYREMWDPDSSRSI